MSRRAVLTTVEVLMVLSVPAFFLIPFGPVLGLDFQNLDAFHDCFARNDPWSVTGAACGDVLDRDMYYPPLLYWSFAWTRLLPMSAAYLVWAIVIVAGVFLATMAWVPRTSRNGVTVLFAVLLLLQFPALFAIERGNNDVLVLISWTIAMHLFVSAHWSLSGAVAGIAAAAKLYPALAAAVVGAGLLQQALRDRTAWRPLARFTAGGLAALVVAVVLTYEQTRSYLVDEGAVLVGVQNDLSPWSHTLDSIAPGGSAWLLSLPLLVAWGIASGRRLSRDPIMVFAGGLAISTYFGSVSNDYNLITTYPLLTILFVRALDARRHSDRLTVALLLFGLVAVVGNRWLFVWSEIVMQLHIALQWSWLLSTGVAVAAGRLRETEPADPSHRMGRAREYQSATVNAR